MSSYFELQAELDRYRRRGKGGTDDRGKKHHRHHHGGPKREGGTATAPPPPARTTGPTKSSSASSWVRSYSAVNFRVSGVVPPIRQPKSNDCWATAYTMLASWRQGRSVEIRDALAPIGAKYVQFFDTNAGLPNNENAAFTAAAGLVAEPPMNYSPEGVVRLLQSYGPLIVTTDNGNPNDNWVHSRVLVGITGDGTAAGTTVQIVDPGTGTEYSQPLNQFARDYESPEGISWPMQVVHWPSGTSASQSDFTRPYPRSYSAANYTRSFTTPMAYGARVSQAFRDRVAQIAAGLGTDPNFLMAAMAFETGETFSASVQNRTSGATGLIQFMPSTAQSLGTTTAALAAMTAEAQLDYVERYFRPYSGRLASLEDVYMAILWPRAVGQPNSTILFSAPSRAYQQNRGLDTDNDGNVTKAEAAAMVRRRLATGLQPGNVG